MPRLPQTVTMKRQNGHSEKREYDVLQKREKISFVGVKTWLLVGVVTAVWLFNTLRRNIMMQNEMNLWNQEQQYPAEGANALRDNGLTKDVQWDKYSLFIKGQRVFLWSGEVHPWRIPVKSQWLDILHKVKASGMNAISVYAHW
jgi:hypothetical protein